MYKCIKIGCDTFIAWSCQLNAQTYRPGCAHRPDNNLPKANTKVALNFSALAIQYKIPTQ
jgi:hypothetical protein